MVNKKKNCLKYIIVGVLIILFISLFVGCKSKENEKNLRKITDDGLEYFNKKYDVHYQLEKSDYIYTDSGLFGPDRTEDIMIETTDGVKIIYLADEKKFYDNMQVEEIQENFDKKIWNPLLKKIGTYKIQVENYSDYGTDEIQVKLNMDYRFPDSESFFHEFYDGDIKKFVKKEKVSIDLIKYNSYKNHNDIATLFIFAKSKEDCLQKITLLQNALKEYTDWYGPNIICLTPELYEQYDKLINTNEELDLDIGFKGCWAEGQLFDLDIQNYIKVEEGIYFSPTYPNIDIKEGDIFFEEVTDKKELALVPYAFGEKTKVYKMVSSKEFGNKLKDEDEQNSNCIDGFFAINLKEAGLSEEYNLYSAKDSVKSVLLVSGTSTNSEFQSSVGLNEHSAYYWVGKRSH